jgi:hypothetical protein
MISKAVEYLIIAIAGLALLWFFNDRIEAHYQKPLIDAHKAAIELQAVANKQSIEALAKAKGKIQVVYVDKITEIKAYEKTLSPDSACRATPEFIRLFNSVSR